MNNLPSSKIKVLHAIWGLPANGAETALVRLINESTRECVHKVICISTGASEGLLQRLTSSVSVVIPKKFYSSGLTSWFNKLAWLRRETKAFRPDILRTYGWAGIDAILANYFDTKLKIIHSEHGLETFEKYSESLIKKILIQNALRRVNAFIAVSQNLVRIAEEKFRVPKNKISYISNGIDTKRFSNVQNPLCPSEFGLDESSRIVGFVGRLQSVKNLFFLLKVFSTFLKEHQAARLLLVGEGELKDELKERVRELGIEKQVVFAGVCHDVERIYPIMACLVVTSTSEQCPNVVLEAMASGLPIAASRVGDIEYLVSDRNKSLLFESNNEKEFLEKLNRVFRNKENGRQIGGDNQRKVQQFSLETMKEKYLELYRRQ